MAEDGAGNEKGNGDGAVVGAGHGTAVGMKQDWN